MRPLSEYKDFEIELQSSGRSRFRATVMGSPSGRAKESMLNLPYKPEALEELLGGIEAQIRQSSSASRDAKRVDESEAPPPAIDAAVLGRRLFKALFPPQIQTHFRTSWARLQGEAVTGARFGLRVRLTFAKTDDLDAFALLASYPWEFLVDGDEILALDRSTPIVRSIGDRALIEPIEVNPLRVLLVQAQPLNLEPLRTKAEEDDLLHELRKNKSFETHRMSNVTLSTLRDKLLETGAHVLHFMGHGGYLDSAKKKIGLWFEDEDGLAEGIDGSMLGYFMKGLPDLRLVVLNACWGAASRAPRDRPPVTAVAAALLDKGIPAVVAMQQPISDLAASRFSRAFYKSLAEGDSLAAAITEGRLKIWEKDVMGLEWGTPVLFLKDADRLFKVAPPEPVKSPKVAERRVTRATVRSREKAPLYLRVQTFNPAFLVHFPDGKKHDGKLDLTDCFEGPGNRFIREPSLWQEEVFPRLQAFLARYADADRPLVFDFAAHWSVVFAAGWCLETKSGLDIRLLQKSLGGSTSYEINKLTAGPSRLEPLFAQRKSQLRRGAGSDLAVALEVTWSIAGEVRHYLDKEVPSAGRLLPLTLFPRPNTTGIADARHALQIAQGAAHSIRKRTLQEQKGPVHLFASAPNSLLFYLGQHAGSLGSVQLYEHDFGKKRHGTYEPSLHLPIQHPRES